MNEDITKFKIIFLGDQSVGKSSILNRFSQDKFEPNYQATIGLDFHSKNATINGENVKLLLYDTAGQEKFRSLIPMYIRDANVIIVVYDVTVMDSFTHTNHWVTETEELRRQDAIFCLVGNKIDLSDKRVVTEEKGAAFAKSNDYLFAEVSAKDGTGIQELFYDIIFKQIGKKFKIQGDGNDLQEKPENKVTDGGTIKLGLKEEPTTKKKKGCCGGGKGKKQKSPETEKDDKKE